jgi:hypothetical protein
MAARTYTDEELLARVWDVEEIKKLVYKRGVYIANGWNQRELDELWVSDPELKKSASFGKNTGWYVGMDAIAAWYVKPHGVGYMAFHPASTGLVELAGDGKTAKGLFYCIAQETTPNGDGTARALWIPHKIGFDFVKEADGWKIWHAIAAIDLVNEAGETYNDQDPYMDYETNPVFVDFGTPTVPCLTHDVTFNWWDDYPPMPEPYETFTPDISYGPEGWKAPKEKHYGAKEGKIK